MYNPFSLEGKTILITGASSGIGRATAIECSKLGAKVVITARNQERLRETLSMMEGEDHSMLLCDMSDTVQIEDLVKALPEIHGLVNNAGFSRMKPVSFIGANDLKDVFAVNTIAPIMILKLLLKKKKIKAGASVVFTSSIAGLGKTAVGTSIYTCSKGAISAFVANAALELAQKQIRVNAVCPGMVKTSLIEGNGVITSEDIEKDKMNYPLGRYGKPEDVAWAMVYLLSDASAWVTGTNMVVDGGYTVR